MAEWRFPSNDYGENKGINDSGVATFRGTPLKSLAREICQNSLDAAAEGKDKVRVEFSMFHMNSNEIPGVEVLRDTFKKCLEFWGGQKALATKDFFNAAIKEIEKDKVVFLRISDFNTTGLKGSREPINTDWTNLTKSSGASDKRGAAGGSYGIGKFAPFACSYFSTVFYSTYDVEGEKASQGVARLVTFTRDDGENTQGTGYYGAEKNTPEYEEMILDPNFKRKENEFGSDIYIAGYKFAGQSWDKDIIISVLDGFLGAIWNGKLEVVVGDTLISKDSLGDLVELYREDLTGYTEGYYKVLVSDETMWSTTDFNAMGEIKLGLLMGDNEAPKRIAMIRQTGMKIIDKDRLPSHVPIIGVMFINGDEINRRLRLIENPEHTAWQPARSANPTADAALLRELNTFIKKKIEELVASSISESIDAVGVGTFLPDDFADTKEENKDEVVSDKVLDIEIKKVKKRKTPSNSKGEDDNPDFNEKKGHMEPGGDDDEWFHNGGHTHFPGDKPGQPAHYEPGGSDVPSKSMRVGLSKFLSICVDKSKGRYMVMVVPAEDGENGTVEIYLSAESQNYEAPIKSAILIGGNVTHSGNKLKGLNFKKGEAMRFSLDLDFQDYCSMEVRLYATKK